MLVQVEEVMKTFYELLNIDPEAALKDITARRELHRAIRHSANKDSDFFDCATCGVLDSQLNRAKELTK